MTKISLKSMSSYGNPYLVEFNIRRNKGYVCYWKHDRSPAGLYQLLSDKVINQPYVDLPNNFFNHGNVTIYHDNHDTAHSIRQLINTDFFLNLVKRLGLEPIKKLRHHSPWKRWKF